MKTNSRFRQTRRPAIIGGILVAAATLALAAVPASAAAATPGPHALPTLSGYTSSKATAVNNFGVVVGYASNDSTDNEAVKWSQSGTVTDLGNLPGGKDSQAFGINDEGDIVGVSAGHAVEWNAAGAITDLGAIPGTLNYSSANAVNDLGVIVGSDQSGYRAVGATSWRDGAIDDFGANESDDLGDSRATAVNEFGTIVGGSFAHDGSSGSVVWNSDGSYRKLPGLPGGRGPGSIANAVDNLGVIVGSSSTATRNQPHAVRWDEHDNVIDLGLLPGGTTSFAAGINDLGLIVGAADDSVVSDRAVTWNLAGTLKVLPSLPGSTFSEALAVSDTGLIVGDGNDAAGNDVAIRWH